MINTFLIWNFSRFLIHWSINWCLSGRQKYLIYYNKKSPRSASTQHSLPLRLRTASSCPSLIFLYFLFKLLFNFYEFILFLKDTLLVGDKNELLDTWYIIPSFLFNFSLLCYHPFIWAKREMLRATPFIYKRMYMGVGIMLCIGNPQKYIYDEW